MTFKELLGVFVRPVNIVLVDVNGMPLKENSTIFANIDDDDLMSSSVEVVSILEKNEIYIKLGD